MKHRNQNSKVLRCIYPNCYNCNDTFEVPECMLIDSGIDINENIIVIPYEGYVLIRQDDEDEKY